MWWYCYESDGCVVSMHTHGLGFSPALMKSCVAVTLDVTGYRSLNCYLTALTHHATGYISYKLIPVCTTNYLLGHIVYVVLLVFVSELWCRFCSNEYDVFRRYLSCRLSYTVFFIKRPYRCFGGFFCFILHCFSIFFVLVLHFPALFNLILNKHVTFLCCSPYFFCSLPFSWEHTVMVLDWFILAEVASPSLFASYCFPICLY